MGCPKLGPDFSWNFGLNNRTVGKKEVFPPEDPGNTRTARCHHGCARFVQSYPAKKWLRHSLHVASLNARMPSFGSGLIRGGSNLQRRSIFGLEINSAMPETILWPALVREFVNLLKKWCRGTELNRRRQPFQGCALPPELPRHELSFWR